MFILTDPLVAGRGGRSRALAPAFAIAAHLLLAGAMVFTALDARKPVLDSVRMVEVRFLAPTPVAEKVVPKPPAVPPVTAPAPVPPKAAPTPPKRMAKPVPVAPSPSPIAAPVAVSGPVPAAQVPAAPAPAGAPAPVVTEARFDAAYLSNPKPVYPPASRRRGETGTVLLRVQVGEDGLPLRVELKSSSGSMLLDRSALDTVERWKFVPARHGDTAIVSWVVVPITFTLN